MISKTHLANKWSGCCHVTAFLFVSAGSDQSKQCGVKRNQNGKKYLQCIIFAFGPDQSKWTIGLSWCEYTLRLYGLFVFCSHNIHQQGTDIIQLEEHYISKNVHMAHECLQNGLSLLCMDSIGEEIVSVCGIGRALLFSSLNILPFMVTSLASSALLIISFREGSECMHEQPHVFFLFASLCVAVWAHTCMCASLLWTHLLPLKAF